MPDCVEDEVPEDLRTVDVLLLCDEVLRDWVDVLRFCVDVLRDCVDEPPEVVRFCVVVVVLRTCASALS